MPAAEIFFLARVIRAAIVGSATRNARAISAVVRPPSSRSVSATLASAGSAGWQQVNSSRSRSSGMVDMSVTTSGSSGISSGSLRASVASRRNRSVAFRRAAVSSHASGLAGIPSRAQAVSALSYASWSDSSATSRLLPTSRVSRASRRPQCSACASSTARRAAWRGAAVLLGVRVLDGPPVACVAPLGARLDGLPGADGAARVRLLDRCPRAHFSLRTSSLSLGSSGIFFPHSTASSMLGTSIR